MVALLIAIMTAAVPPARSAPPDDPPGAGVPLALAADRAKRLRDVRYELELSIPAQQTERLRGRITVRFLLQDASRRLALDFAGAEPVGPVSAGGRGITVERVRDHLLVSQADLREGENAISIEFLAGDGPLNRNPEFLYTLFVPARAHLAFPCFDQPDLKARWTLTLEIPPGWAAVSNGAESDRRASRGGHRVRFAETAPLPTYLFAFAAGRFRVETARRGERTFRMFHRETDPKQVARNREAIFDLHASALEWLEGYAGIPYPWGKFDFVLLPAFQFGGMEHAGAIFYNAPGLFLEPSATQNQQLNRARLIAHETAHMWFGDLVTMRWFDDVWLKEVFANFMAGKIVNPAFPEIDHALRFLLAHYPAAYEIDRTPGTHPIRQRLENLRDAGTLYGPIIYDKAPIVMRQLEFLLGEDRLREGLREYLRRHAFGNASWPDLIRLLDERTPHDLAAWSHVWVQESGRPIITTELQVTDGRIERLLLRQRDPVRGRGLTWTQRLVIAVGVPDGLRTFDVAMREPVVEVTDARGLPAPEYVLPGGAGIGYGSFELDAGTLAFLSRRLPEIDDALTRGAAWVTLWDQMLEARVTPAGFLDLSLRALPRETDEQNVQRILNYVRPAFWRFLPPAARADVGPALERVLRDGMDRADTQSLKSAWFSALRDTAQSAPVLDWLERVWRRAEPVPGLTLTEIDEIELALELAVREVPAWNEILALQLARTENPDRKARFAFVRPALSARHAERDAFFESLKDVKNRAREPWVLEGLNYLHHPLRAPAAEKYIPPGLRLLEELQRTGDIFFPKRWTDATLSGHGSAPAAALVRAFLDGLPPAYPDRLKRIVLASADDLFRAARLRD